MVHLTCQYSIMGCRILDTSPSNYTSLPTNGIPYIANHLRSGGKISQINR